MKEIEERRAKFEWFRKQGIELYPYKFDQKHHAADITSAFSKFDNKKVKVAGRLMAIRGHGKAGFADLTDASGKIQLFLAIDTVGKQGMDIFQHLDRGDIVGAEGTVFKSQRGEITIRVKNIELLSKCLQPLPDTWFGLKDVEIRYRRRYLDMIMNPDVRKVFEVRSKLLTAFREFLDQNGFWEVETPVLQPIYGGAHAKPFVTHHNALDFDFFLRISDELYLKRLIIGGFEGVYEVSRDFRNEGIDRTHNPEFTQIEFYKCYWDYNDMMDFVEKLFRHMAKKSIGKTVVEFQGNKIDLGKKWIRITLRDAIKKYLKIDINTIKNDAEALKIAKKLGIEDATTRPFIIDEMIKLIRREIIQPTFLMDYPIELCPLTKPKRGSPALAEIFQPIIAGMEMGRAFSELNDPTDQRKRFEVQQKEKEAGAEETQPTDEDFIIAQEYGMPPLGGVGISIDRPSMLFTNMPCIRDVLAFPAMRPEEGAEPEKTQEIDIFSQKSLVVGKVESIKPHPNADKLKVCSVDIGSKKLQIVCGCSNLRKGLCVAVALPGTKTLDWKGSGKAQVIKAGEIRGVKSEGMMCAAEELGIHVPEGKREGLLILKEGKLGTPAGDIIKSQSQKQ